MKLFGKKVVNSGIVSNCISTSRPHFQSSQSAHIPPISVDKKKKGEKKKKKKEDNCISNSGLHLQSSKSGHIPPIWCRLLELLSKLEVEAIS